MIRLDENRIVLCKKGSCCPIVTNDADGGIKITDDFGGAVKLDKDEVEMLKRVLDGEEVK